MKLVKHSGHITNTEIHSQDSQGPHFIVFDGWGTTKSVPVHGQVQKVSPFLTRKLREWIPNATVKPAVKTGADDVRVYFLRLQRDGSTQRSRDRV